MILRFITLKFSGLVTGVQPRPRYSSSSVSSTSIARIMTWR